VVQVAQAAKNKESKLRKFFLGVKAKKGYNAAVVALARKILCILHYCSRTGNCIKKKV
jgi:transposase